MATLDYRATCELTKPVTIKHLDGMFFSQDVQANRIVVSVYRKGIEEPLSGTVSANIIRADGGTVAQAGEIDGNVATVTMPAAAYAVPGAIAVFVKLTQDGATSTIAAVSGYVYKSTTDTIIDPGTIIPSVQDLIDSIADAAENLEETVAELTEDIDEAIARIPQDYQDLEDDVSDLKNEIGMENKFDGVLYNGYWNSNAQLVSATTDVCNYNKISCAENTTVTIKGKTTFTGVSYFISYLDDNTRLRRDTGTGTNYTGVAPAGTKYVCFVFEKSGMNKDNFGTVEVYIDTEIDKIKSNIDSIESEIESLENNKLKPLEKNVEFISRGSKIEFSDVDDGHYWDSNGTYASSSALKSSYSELIPCKEGDRFIYVCGTYNATAKPAVICYNNGAVTRNITYTYDKMERTLVIAANETHVRFQNVSASSSNIQDHYAYQINPESIDHLTIEQAEQNSEIRKNTEYINRVQNNLINKTVLMQGTLDSEGEFVENETKGVTDFIPIEQGIAYYLSSGQCYCYDSEKEYLRKRAFVGNLSNDNANTENGFPASDEAYVRILYEDNLIFCKYDDNLQRELNGSSDCGISRKMAEAISDNFDLIADEENQIFTKSKNLFNYREHIMYIAPTAGYCVVRNTGAFKIYGSDLKVKKGISDFPTGATIATPHYFAVQAGKSLCSNYAINTVIAYDSSKSYIGLLEGNGIEGRGTNYPIPNGCAYVRINFIADKTSSATNVIHSLEETKGITVKLVDTTEYLASPCKFEPFYQISGEAISPDLFDVVQPKMSDSYFLSAMKCMMIREMNKRDNAFRFGNFNLWSPQKTYVNWEMTKHMLMDLGIDFCGFEEVQLSTSGYQINISNYMKSWQFKDGFIVDREESTPLANQSFVSRYELTETHEYRFANPDQPQMPNSRYINCRLLLPEYLDIQNARKTLSVYVLHSPITSASKQREHMLELLTVIASDTSDFIVIMGDMNDFGNTEETKTIWRTLEAGGFTPVLPIESKTITSDTETSDYPSRALDQFFISDNISVLNYNIINTKYQYTISEGGKIDNQDCLSDHDFVYCDLRFDYNTPRTIVPVPND